MNVCVKFLKLKLVGAAAAAGGDDTIWQMGLCGLMLWKG